MSQSASDMVDLYIQAEKDLLDGKMTEINGRRYMSEDLNEIRKGRKEWEKRLSAELSGSRSRGPSLATF